NAETDRLVGWALAEAVPAATSDAAMGKLLYSGNARAIEDRLRLAFASARGRAVEDDKALVEAGQYSRLLGFLKNWERPALPITGEDLRRLGLPQGKGLGRLLAELETEWIQSGFTIDRGTLLKRAAEKGEIPGS
ncbi:MAG: CCA tRNA nucleotidyltransferase, partial [Rhizobiaceae bacterium]